MHRVFGRRINDKTVHEEFVLGDPRDAAIGRI